MASIIEGYNYDIFISYRQKDNKGDMWVSNFVSALKVELEATFKEDISVYFDENPNDRLQETHDVSKTLEGKLKALIFIPVLSQTYCDKASYAWNGELLPFISHSKDDKHGLDVKLRNGNIASRILPVRIHDLEPEDIRLFEEATGSVMRPLDFVFRMATGVNRPLRSNEEHPHDNLNKVFYNDQINKLSQSIKEIILAVRLAERDDLGHDAFTRNKPVEIEENNAIHRRSNKNKFAHTRIRSLAISLVLILVCFFAILKFVKKDRFKDVRNSDGRITIAVMPFENHTGDTSLNWFGSGVSSLILNSLGNSPELSVKDDQAIYDVLTSMGKVYIAGLSGSEAREAAGKLKAGTYVSGSFQGSGNVYRILANLADSKSGEVIFTRMVEGNIKSSNYMTMVDSLCSEFRSYLEIKALEGKANYDFREVYPKSPEALRYFQEGMEQILKSRYRNAISLLGKAIEIDSTFTFASFYIAFAYCFLQQADWIENASKWIKRSYLTKEKLPLKYQYWLELWYACFVSRNYQDIVKFCNLLEESDIESRFMWFDLGVTYNDYFDNMSERSLRAFERVDEISRERGEEWNYDKFYQAYGDALLKAGRPEDVILVSDRGLKLNPSNGWLLLNKGSAWVMKGDTSKINQVLAEIRGMFEKYKADIAWAEYLIGNLFKSGRDTINAIKHYRISVDLNPNDLWRKEQLAELLIKSKTGIEEGLKIIEEVLLVNPGSYGCIYYKGLALHQIGDNIGAIKLINEANMLNPIPDNPFWLNITRHIEESVAVNALKK